MSRVPSPPDFPHTMSLGLAPTGGERRADLSELKARFRALAERLGGRFEVLGGVVMNGPLDGFTEYLDVYGTDCVATLMYGLDYGHSLFVEMRADTMELLETLRAEVIALFSDAFFLEEVEHRQGQRVWQY